MDFRCCGKQSHPRTVHSPQKQSAPQHICSNIIIYSYTLYLTLFNSIAHQNYFRRTPGQAICLHAPDLEVGCSS